jgi:hypothetical protein
MCAAIRRYEIPVRTRPTSDVALQRGLPTYHQRGARIRSLLCGLRGSVLRVVRGDVVLTTVSVFEDLAGAQSSTDAAADYVKQNLASLLPQSPTATAGEVVAYKGKQGQ